MSVNQRTVEQAIEKYVLPGEPYYLPVGSEVELFEAAYRGKLPVMLKGPTGCGKTRFIEYMAWRLNRPLITVACHEDLSATDLVGRFLLRVTRLFGTTARSQLRSRTARFCILTKWSKLAKTRLS